MVEAVKDSLDPPDYVVTEAESVIDRVLAAQGNRTFTFAAISDMHYNQDSYPDGIKHACEAMKYIDERIKLDAVAVLGDYTDNYPESAYADAVADFKAINQILTGLRFGQNLRIQGNHDYYATRKGETNRFISAYSDDVVWGNITGGYFYKDFGGYKLRVICVNTTETGNNNLCVSTDQYKWFIESLDMTAKEDAAEWQILILSHHPLDWWTDSYVFTYVLDAYKNGTSWTNGTISCNFADKNAATLVGNIHGHIHNFKTDFLHFGNVNGNSKSSILRMATPNACYGRENQYDAATVGVSTWVEDTTYSKTQNSADDTAFVIYCVDLDTFTVTAVCYGAGYDRTEVYAEPGIVNIIDTIGYTDGKRLGTSDGGFRDNTATMVTNMIPFNTVGDVFRTSGLSFEAASESNCGVWVYYGDQSYWTYINTKKANSPISIPGSWGTIEIDASGNLTVTAGVNAAGYIRLVGIGSGANLVVTKNQEID